MKAEIKIKRDKVVCDVIGCEGEAKFKWYYHHNSDMPLNRIGKSGNEISWFGYGIYYVEVICDNNTTKANKIFTDGSSVNIKPLKSGTKVTAKSRGKDVYISSVWDFSRLPEDAYQEVIDFVKQDNIKRLALIHNDYKLSDAFYCCGDLSVVRDKFKKFVDDLSGGESKVVENSK